MQKKRLFEKPEVVSDLGLSFMDTDPDSSDSGMEDLVRHNV